MDNERLRPVIAEMRVYRARNPADSDLQLGEYFRYLARIGWFAAAIKDPAEVAYCLKASGPG